MNINHYTKIFIKNIMFGLGNVHLSLLDESQVYKVIEKAYIAMTPRTLGKGKEKGAKISPKNKAIIFSNLASVFVDYFKARPFVTQQEFDEWHNKVCADFMNDFNNVLRTSNYKKRMKYGKAQKIVNIAFKYLYLFCDIVPGNPSHFSFCHFAIDSTTLTWYKKNIDSGCTVGNWSDMTYGEYIEIQKNIRAYISKNMPDKTPFEAEFEIWSDWCQGK